MDELINKFEGKTLHCMCGLPRSGKGTFARKLSKEIGAPIIDPDCVRLSVHGKPFLPEKEPFVWKIVLHSIEALFLAGHSDVILDCVNHTPKRRQAWISNKWATKWYLQHTPKEICLQRAIDTNQPYLIPVIERMAKEADWNLVYNKV